MNVECVDYRKLPGQHPLFSHYLYDNDSGEAFYSNPLLITRTE